MWLRADFRVLKMLHGGRETIDLPILQCHGGRELSAPFEASALRVEMVGRRGDRAAGLQVHLGSGPALFLFRGDSRAAGIGRDRFGVAGIERASERGKKQEPREAWEARGR